MSIMEGKQTDSYCANLDSAQFVGTICYWPKDIFEFQFNDCASGEVIVLETLSFENPTSLGTYLHELIFKKLRGA